MWKKEEMPAPTSAPRMEPAAPAAPERHAYSHNPAPAAVSGTH